VERRRFKRINALLNQEEHVLIEYEGRYVAATIVDFGVAGALLAMKDPGVHFQDGDTFSLCFDNGGQLLQLKGVALRTNESHAAFRFSEVTVDQEKAIRTKMIRMELVAARIGARSQVVRIHDEIATNTRD
jgi:hypothetical protein